MFALFSRILKLSGRYKSRIQGAFVCAFLESILSKMPIFLAFVVLSGFANKTITGQTCLYVGLGLAAIVLVQMLVHYLSDSLQSAAGYLMFADKRIELGGHLRKLPMGYFTSGNIGKISSVLSTDMVFIEEVAMSTLGNMMSYLLSSLVLLAFMFYLNWQLGLIAAIVTILAWLVSKGMNKVSLREAAGRQEQSERLTDAVLSFVEGIGVIKSYSLLGEKSEELSGNFKRSRNTSLDFERKMTPWTMGLNILYGIGIAAIFGLSIVLEQSGALSLAYVLSVLLFVFDLFGPLKALYGEASRLTVMNAALDRIEAVLDEPELSDNGKQHIPAQAQPGQPEVLFNDVTFAYQDKEVLHHMFSALHAEKAALLRRKNAFGRTTAFLAPRMPSQNKKAIPYGMTFCFGGDKRDRTADLMTASCYRFVIWSVLRQIRPFCQRKVRDFARFYPLCPHAFAHTWVTIWVRAVRRIRRVFCRSGRGL